MQTRTRVGALVAAGGLVLGLAACQNPVAVDAVAEQSRVVRRRTIDLEKVTLERTTPQDLEALFGAPDQREPDGAWVYHTDRESVTFRFRNGVLSRFCRTRT
jgi:hypothetical protein